jgi:hypothetical protein
LFLVEPRSWAGRNGIESILLSSHGASATLLPSLLSMRRLCTPLSNGQGWYMCGITDRASAPATTKRDMRCHTGNPALTRGDSKVPLCIPQFQI